jgi:hypothetical protein
VTREQIENGAAHYDVEAAKAYYDAKYLEKMGADDRAAQVKSKADEYQEIAKRLRRLAP